jgi:hypothetical protein
MKLDIESYPDRKWIEKEYLPVLKGKILFVGTASYTDHYSTLIPTNSIWHTIDHNPKAVGISSIKHYTDTLLNADIDETYDHISLHGLWGSRGGTLEGIQYTYNNTITNLNATLNKAKNILNVNGTIMVGIRWIDNIYPKSVCFDIFKEHFAEYNELYNAETGKAVIYWGQKCL